MSSSPGMNAIKPVLDRFLLAIEILAVVGLIFIIYNGIQILRDLNTQFTASLIPLHAHPHTAHRSCDFTFRAHASKL